MQGQKATVRLSVGLSNDNVLFEQQCHRYQYVERPALGAARQSQEGEIARFKGCSHRAKPILGGLHHEYSLALACT
jgi:hypothetical protein